MVSAFTFFLQLKKVNKKSRRCAKMTKIREFSAKIFKLLLLASEALPRSLKALAVAKRRRLISILDKSYR